LKAGLWFRRARLVILAPDPRHPRRAQAENPLNDLSEFSRPPLYAAPPRAYYAPPPPVYDTPGFSIGFGFR